MSNLIFVLSSLSLSCGLFGCFVLKDWESCVWLGANPTHSGANSLNSCTVLVCNISACVCLSDIILKQCGQHVQINAVHYFEPPSLPQLSPPYAGKWASLVLVRLLCAHRYSDCNIHFNPYSMNCGLIS